MKATMAEIQEWLEDARLAAGIAAYKADYATQAIENLDSGDYPLEDAIAMIGRVHLLQEELRFALDLCETAAASGCQAFGEHWQHEPPREVVFAV